MRALVGDGVTVVVAAGNDEIDACDSSPSRVTEAIVVGATMRDDTRWWYSNYGPCVDFYAPGYEIKSAYYTGDARWEILSGTSMAAPHVAGAAARYLSTHAGATPAEVEHSLRAAVTKDVVGDAMSTDNDDLLFIEGRATAAALGTITITKDRNGLNYATTGVFLTSYDCSFDRTNVEVTCTVLDNSPVAYECTLFLLTTWAPAPTDPTASGEARGEVACDDGSIRTADAGPNDPITENSSAQAGVTMGSAGVVRCRALGPRRTTYPLGSYRVECAEPGLADPFSAG